MKDFIPYLIREKGSRILHIGDDGLPLCEAKLDGPVERIYLPSRMGPTPGICGDCKVIYELWKEQEGFSEHRRQITVKRHPRTGT